MSTRAPLELLSQLRRIVNQLAPDPHGKQRILRDAADELFDQLDESLAEVNKSLFRSQLLASNLLMLGRQESRNCERVGVSVVPFPSDIRLEQKGPHLIEVSEKGGGVMGGYLPDGCTQEDCDRAANGRDEPEEIDGCDLCGSPDDEPCDPECPRWKPPQRVGVTPPEERISDEECPF